MERGIDPVLVSIFQQAFRTITEEMDLTLLRTTRSPIFNEAKDFATSLLDAKGRLLEQWSPPILSLSIGPSCKYIIAYFGEETYAGDIIIHNDVFSFGNQNADLTIFKPIFYGEDLVAWSACKGHVADIGGAVAGGYNPNAREVWQEALRIPPVKIYEKGRFRKDVWNLIFANIRFSMVAEDAKAQIGSCVVGERGIKKLIDRYGLEVFNSHVEALFDMTERMVRNEIRSMPEGIYRGESYMNFDGITEGTRSRIMVTIEVKGDEISFDFIGTDPQTPGFVNSTFSATLSAIIMAFRMLINPDIPHNEGIIRPVHINIPEGSILNAKFPAATTFGNHLCEQVVEAVFKAFSDALPDRITAGWNRMLCGIINGIDPRKGHPYVDILFPGTKGGGGATHGVDGYSHIGTYYAMWAITQDYEMLELQDPLLLLKHEYLEDSAGVGRWRGGMGVEFIFEFQGKNTMAVTIGDGMEEASFGLLGGKEGIPNEIKVIFPNKTAYIPKTKDIIPIIPKGSLWKQKAGGGGGYGDPYLRLPEKVRDDVKNGFVSIEKAKEDYGVVIDPTSYEIDYEETEKIRKRGYLELI